MIHQPISEHQASHLLALLHARDWPATFEPEKHQIRYSTAFGNVFFRLPLQMSITHSGSITTVEPLNYVMVLLESGLAAVGYFEDNDTIHHKVFRAYMVRKKQGKSQLKHLKTKGKSRAGSRVRLAESLQFFADINQQLTAYLNEYRVDKIAVSLSTTLLPYFYGSKTPPPFEKSDPRLFQIPKHIPACTYENLTQTHRFLRMGELKFPSEAGLALQQILQRLAPQDEEADSEDW